MLNTQRELIHKLCKDVLYNSVGQAVITIIDTPHVSIRAFLFVSVIVSSCLCSYLVIQSLLAYFNYEVITMSRLFFETPTLFPRIKICNGSPFTTEFAFEFVKNVSRVASPDLDMFDMTKVANLTKNEKFYLFRQIADLAIAKMNAKNFTDENRRRLGHTIEDILYSCTFNTILCNASDFIWEFDRIRGNCYVYNSGLDPTVPLKQSSIAGSLYGLRVSFYVNTNEKLVPINAFVNFFDAIISIENGSHLNEFHLDGVRVPSGFETHISVDRSFKFNLPKPYSNCDLDNDLSVAFDSELYNLFAHSPREYTQQICLTQCYQQELERICNCTSPYHLSLFKGWYLLSVSRK